MIQFPITQIAAYYRARVPKLKQAGAEWRGPCPIHRGQRNSFAVDPATGRWCCHSDCGRGGDMIELEMALTGTDFNTAKAEVFRIVGRSVVPTGTRPREVATYDYRDEGGRLLFQSVRMEPKDFRQRRPKGTGGWVWNLKGVRLVLYRLQELAKRTTETVFICEGERDVESLERPGLLAICNPMGAGKWRAEYSEAIRGRSVVILPDNDGPGRVHALAVAECRRHDREISARDRRENPQWYNDDGSHIGINSHGSFRSSYRNTRWNFAFGVR